MISMSLDIETNIRRHTNYNTNYKINIMGNYGNTIRKMEYNLLVWCKKNNWGLLLLDVSVYWNLILK